ARSAVEAVGVNGIPMANAGPDQVVAPGATVTLTGTGTAFPTKTVHAAQCTQTGGANVTLGSANTATATFTAPASGSMVFRLRVTDDQNKTADDLMVGRVNKAPGLGGGPAARGGG